jgi:hypothetical protein
LEETDLNLNNFIFILSLKHGENFCSACVSSMHLFKKEENLAH